MARYYYNNALLYEFHTEFNDLVSNKYLYLLKVIDHTNNTELYRFYASQNKFYYNDIENKKALFSTEEHPYVVRSTVNYGETWEYGSGEASADTDYFVTYIDSYDENNKEYILVWTNEDVYKVGTTDLYFQGSEPVIYIASRNNYNGVALPKLPTDISTEYPYCIIVKTVYGGDTMYSCVFSKGEFYVGNDESGSYLSTTVIPCHAYNINDSGEWENPSPDEPTEDVTMRLGEVYMGDVLYMDISILWSNHDVLYEGTTDVYLKGSNPTTDFDVTTLVKQSILDEYPKCVILTKEESNGTNILVCYSDKPLYLDEEETTVRRISGTLGVVESYLRTSDGELLVQGTKTLYEVFPAVLYTKKYDINKDGVLDKADSDAIHNHFMGSATITDAETLENADMNKDGVIDTTDAVLLQNIIERGEGAGFAIAWSNYTLDVLYKIFKGTLINIADSIRAKTGKTDKVPPEIMPEEIESISDGATMEDFEEAFLGGEW